MRDFSNYKFHPSGLGELMKNDRSGKNVGETAKKALLEIWIEATYGRQRDIENKYMQKGTLVEEEAMTLYCLQRKKFFKKNIETFENDYFIGTPDILDTDEVIDLKSSWSLFTFYDNIMKKLDSNYEYQLQAYMNLTGRNKARLAYVLVDTPLFIIEQEKSRLRYKFSEIDPEINPAYVAAAAQIEKNGTFGDIPESERWMEFKLESRGLKDVFDRLDWCRAFLNDLNNKS
jgi:hypothetical protein